MKTDDEEQVFVPCDAGTQTTLRQYSQRFPDSPQFFVRHPEPQKRQRLPAGSISRNVTAKYDFASTLERVNALFDPPRSSVEHVGEFGVRPPSVFTQRDEKTTIVEIERLSMVCA